MTKNIKTYSELIKLPTFIERYEYLKLSGKIGLDTFGFDRYLNQKFYHSAEWRSMRNWIIDRDNACDLADPDREMESGIVIHHMNPIGVSDIVNLTDYLLNPEYLIVTSDRTHKAIHYGDRTMLRLEFRDRYKNDTCPWKKH